MSTELGKAYVQIMPSAKGISGSIQKTLEPEAKAAGKSAGNSIASNITSSLGKMGDTLTSKITKPVAVATTAVGGLVGALGFRRLVGMDNAQAKLKGLGYAAQDIDDIIKTVNESVTGTTHTMAEGTDVAAGALAAGVKQGKDLERYIKLVGDAATGANRPMDEMAMIINRVQGSGRLMTQELNMIEHGMPGFSQAMADHLADGSMEAFREMVTNGEVGSDEFLDVMEDFAGGMSEAYAGTWSGMAKNVLANIGIIGEALIDGLFEDGKKAMEGFLDILRSDGLRNWAHETGESIREFVGTVVGGIKTMINWWQQLSTPIQDIIKNIALFGSIGLVMLGPILQMVNRITQGIGLLSGAFTFLFSPLGLIIGAIAALTAGFLYLWETNEDFREFFVEMWEGLKDFFIETWLSISEFVMPIFQELIDFIIETWSFFVEWWQESGNMILEAAQNVWSFITEIISIAMDLIMGIMSVLWPIIETLVIGTWNAIKGAIEGALNVITGIIDAFSALLTGNWGALWDAVKQILSGAVQFLWNLVQVWFVGRIIGVVTRFGGLLRNVVSGAWNAVRGLFSSSLGAIRGLVSSGLNAVRNIFSSIMNGLRGIVSGAFSSVRSAISNGMRNAFNVVKNFFGRFKDAGRKIVTSIADGIKGAVGKVTDAIGNVAGKIRDFLPFSPPKIGPLMDIMDVDWGGTIGGGIEKGEDAVAKAMNDILDFDLPQRARFNNPNYSDNNYKSSQQPQPIILQVDGKKFAQIMGDYTSAEGGNRIRKIERGLA